MSVLHLLGTAGEGGAETYFVDLVTALAGAGVAQSAAIRSNPHRQAALSAAGVPTRVLRFGGPLDLLTTPLTGRFAHRSGARLTLAWMNRAARHAPKGPWARVGRLGGYYNLKYYRGFDALVANTEDIADWIVAQGWPAGRVRCIPNFAAPAADARPVERSALDTPEGAPLLLAMGRLKALAEGLGLSGRVRFLGWRTDASALYRTADLCLFPSRYEPLGNVVIQAWAHGLPVVAAAATGPAALIRDGQDGRLVPVDDPAALADAARDLLDDPAARARLAGAGLARVAGELSPEAVVTRWRELFTEYGAG
jgi:hypothetical protein